MAVLEGLLVNLGSSFVWDTIRLVPQALTTMVQVLRTAWSSGRLPRQRPPSAGFEAVYVWSVMPLLEALEGDRQAAATAMFFDNEVLDAHRDAISRNDEAHFLNKCGAYVVATAIGDRVRAVNVDYLGIGAELWRAFPRMARAAWDPVHLASRFPRPSRHLDAVCTDTSGVDGHPGLAVAKALLDAGQLEEAGKTLAQLQGSPPPGGWPKPASARILALLGVAEARAGKEDAAARLFADSYQLDPRTQTLGNLVIVLAEAGRVEEAEALLKSNDPGHEDLRVFPARATLWHITGNTREILRHAERDPRIRRDQRCALSVAELLLRSRRFDDARSWLDDYRNDPDGAFLWNQARLTELGRQAGSKGAHIVAAADRADLEQIVQTGTLQADKLGSTAARRQARLQVATALTLLGRADEAAGYLGAVLTGGAGGWEESAQYAGLLAMVGKRADAIAAFTRTLAMHVDPSVVRACCFELISGGDGAAALDLVARHANALEPHVVVELSIHGILACGKTEALVALSKLCAADAKVSGEVTAIQSLLRTGSVAAVEALVEDGTTSTLMRAVLANGVGEWLMSRRDWNAALPWLERNVNEGAPDFAIARAALCAFNAGQIDRAAQLASLADDAPDMMRIRAQVYEERGEYQQALAVRKGLAAAVVVDGDNLIALEQLRVRLGDTSGLADLDERLAQTTAKTRMRGAYLLFSTGGPGALDLALGALKDGTDSPEIALAYVNLFLAVESSGALAAPPDVVAEGTAVVLKSDDAKTQRYFITRSPVAWQEVLFPDEPFAAKLLGLQVADEVRQDTLAGERVWTIKEIHSEAVHAFQRTIQTFEQAFPGERSFAAISTENRGLVQLLAAAFAREKHIEQLESALNQGLPIGAAAAATQAEWLDVWGAVRSRPNFELRASDPSEDGWRRQHTLLASRQVLVLDTSALCTVVSTGLDEHPEYFAPWRLLVARAVVDELQDSLNRRLTTAAPQAVMRSGGGLVDLQQLEPSERDTDRRFIERLLAFVRERCEVVSVGGPLAGSPSALRELSELVGRPSAASIRAAHDEHALLWSDELCVRRVAGHLLPSGDVWTQAVLYVGAVGGALSWNDYVRSVQTLIVHRIGYVVINDRFVRIAARAADYRLDDRMEATLKLLGHRDCPTGAAARIGALFLASAWDAIPPLHQPAMVQAVWAALCVGRDWHVSTQSFRQQLNSVDDRRVGREVLQVFLALVAAHRAMVVR